MSHSPIKKRDQDNSSGEKCDEDNSIEGEIESSGVNNADMTNNMDQQRRIKHLESLLTQNLTNLNTGVRVDSHCVPKILPFFRADPSLWFVQAEILLRSANIIASNTKADSILANVDFEVLSCVRDIITADPLPTDIYEKIKDRIIATFAVSSEAQLRQLLEGDVPTDGKPSLVLSRLRNLNSANCDDAR